MNNVKECNLYNRSILKYNYYDDEVSIMQDILGTVTALSHFQASINTQSSLLTLRAVY